MHCLFCFFSNFAKIMCKMKRILFFFLALIPLLAVAQVPTISPTATYYTTGADGQEESGTISSEQNAEPAPPLNAPVRIVFQANPSRPFPDGYSDIVHYDWTINGTHIDRKNRDDVEDVPETTETSIKRNEEEFELVFNESGSYVVKLRAIFYDEEGKNILYEFPEEGDTNYKDITFSITESQLEFPNGISPNGDGRNDELKPKDGFKSIVSFHAIIFNRWGKKLYSWDNVNGSWDGKYNGKVVKDGVYFLHVTAKGSDGYEYNIKKAINVISGYNNGENQGNGTEE